VRVQQVAGGQGQGHQLPAKHGHHHYHEEKKPCGGSYLVQSTSVTDLCWRDGPEQELTQSSTAVQNSIKTITRPAPVSPSRDAIQRNHHAYIFKKSSHMINFLPMALSWSASKLATTGYKKGKSGILLGLSNKRPVY
jgi:hypothetical protein